MTFFDSMEMLEKAFWFIALPTSLIFIIQTIMTFVGLDSSDGNNPDFNGDFDGGEMPFQLFSLRNLINFLLGFSWTGISFYKLIENQFILILISFLVGATFIILFFQIIKIILRLSEDNTFKIQDCINKTGTVYLKIPENKSGSGIVQISVGGTFQEIKAMTSGEEIKSGETVRVVEIIDNTILLVKHL